MMTVPNQNQSDLLRVGLVQMCATRDPAENTKIASELIQQAAEAGAHYVQTPEVTTLMEIDRANMFAKSEPEENNTALLAFQSLAEDLKIWLHIGSIAVHVADGRLANRSFLIRPDGKISARYDKIHMFDVRLPNERSYEESRSYAPGTKVVTAELLGTTLGLSVCYDIRFAYLYRALAQAGAKVLAVPAAFTRTTGRAHWHVLLRARAIETGCYVLAAGQTGDHECGRETFGHSLVVSPWGEVLADGGTDPGVVVCEIDLAAVDNVRRQIPALQHDREISSS